MGTRAALDTIAQTAILTLYLDFHHCTVCSERCWTFIQHPARPYIHQTPAQPAGLNPRPRGRRSAAVRRRRRIPPRGWSMPTTVISSVTSPNSVRLVAVRALPLPNALRRSCLLSLPPSSLGAILTRRLLARPPIPQGRVTSQPVQSLSAPAQKHASLSPALPALFLCLRSFHNENRRRLAGSWVGTSRRSKPTSAAASLPLTTTASRPGPPLFVDRPGSPSLAAGPARLGLRCPHLLCADYPPLMIYN